MSKHGEMAYQYFMRGFNCSQSVAAAFSEELCLSEETVLRMTAGFGAGMGRLREVCGAFSGAVFVLSCLYGSADPSQKSQLYARVQELARQFRNENGGNSIVCRELLGLDRAEGSPQASDRTEEYYRKRPCPQLVRLSADLLSDYLATHPIPGGTL